MSPVRVLKLCPTATLQGWGFKGCALETVRPSKVTKLAKKTEIFGSVLWDLWRWLLLNSWSEGLRGWLALLVVALNISDLFCIKPAFFQRYTAHANQKSIVLGAFERCLAQFGRKLLMAANAEVHIFSAYGAPVYQEECKWLNFVCPAMQRGPEKLLFAWCTGQERSIWCWPKALLRAVRQLTVRVFPKSSSSLSAITCSQPPAENHCSPLCMQIVNALCMRALINTVLQITILHYSY